MAIEFDDSEWFPLINFFKKQDNWQMILEEAGETVIEEARELAKKRFIDEIKNDTLVLVWDTYEEGDY